MEQAAIDRSERFIHLYNQIDDHLRALLLARKPDNDRYATFAGVVREVSKFDRRVANRRDLLLEFADLRNALVHDMGRNGLRYLAEPYQEVVAEFEALVEAIVNPRRAYELGAKNPRRFPPESPLADALEFMRENDFSQIVVQSDGPVNLVTTTGIASWVEHRIGSGNLAIEETRLTDILPREPAGAFDVVGREELYDDLRARFLVLPARNADRLHALVVTHSGKRTEKAIGIITPWDLVDDGRS